MLQRSLTSFWFGFTSSASYVLFVVCSLIDVVLLIFVAFGIDLMLSLLDFIAVVAARCPFRLARETALASIAESGSPAATADFFLIIIRENIRGYWLLFSKFHSIYIKHINGI